ncbi:TetR/AcrR family transcriptional regulator [Streptomyces ochraceiscleroticus]|uniref:TetR/AcrR family transcriptional regulator n=1 Tax=Streptomyces ochraceiscleroticus TaxID=47761 RepID=A0ABW1MP54_9ACTN|nr:TetR/AcrR family transcriptional regulator [Streptomyces ochraceiscleroticus]
MTAIKGARERARGEITAAIKDEARKQLAAEGAAKLSLRAVARELGMVSSALYRYFPSRDDLLTALILDAYNAVGQAAETALAAADARRGRRGGAAAATPAARWTAVCRAVREWALAHPHEYALIYGSPVPGYRAPETTAEPAGRVARALIEVVRDAYAAGALREPDDPLPDAVVGDMLTLVAEQGVELPAGVAARLVGAWAQLFGLVGFELFGQFNRVIEAREEFFEQAVLQLARSVGLPTPAR